MFLLTVKWLHVESYGLENGDFFRYLQLRDYFLKEIQNFRNINGLLDLIVQTYNRKRFKIISVLYHKLADLKDSSTMYIKEKMGERT